MSGAIAAMRDIVVVGGGCYGTFYATQLSRAKERGKAAFRTVIVVDRDPDCRARRELPESADRRFVASEWDAFFDRHLAAARPRVAGDPPDYVVPSPHMSHLMFEWLVRRTRARCMDRAVDVVPVPDSLGTPYDRSGPDHTRYVSFADWICPTHCIEPAVCPAIGGPRSWDMSESVQALSERLRANGTSISGPVLFVCRHQVFGVGMFPVDAVLEGERIVGAAVAAPGTVHVLVGTVSACHGALNLLRIGPSPAEG
jgi:hypothetical protein